MKLRTLLVCLGILMLGLVTALPAAEYDLTLYAAAQPANSNVTGANSNAPGFPDSSWISTATGSGAKSEIYIPVSAILPYSITIGDLQSISYWTNKPGDSGSPDWTFYIYTALGTGTGANEASWYHTRLNSEPYLTGTPSASDPSNTWHEWSTGDPANPMRFYDAGRDGGIYGTYTDPTLANLEAGAINWNSYNSVYANNTYDYRGDVISKFSLQTGSAWGNGFQGMVDGVTIALNNGDTVKLNLDAVPEPASVVMLLTMVGLVGGALRRKAKK